jgi:tetratricopeptide (TPR) repeat protein
MQSYTTSERDARKAVLRDTTIIACAVCCKTVLTTGKKLKACSKCRTVRYCGPKCQTWDYKHGHRAKCATLRRTTASQTAVAKNISVKITPTVPQKACQEHVVELSRCVETGDKLGEAWAYCSLGASYYNAGKPKLDYLLKAWGMFKDLGDRTGELRACYCLAEQYNRSGTFTESMHMYKRCVVLSRLVGDVWVEAVVYSGMGHCLHRLGKYDEALRLFHKCLEIADRLQAPMLQGPAYAGLGGTYSNLRRFTIAVECCERALVCASSTSDTELEIGVYECLGVMRLQSGSFREAVVLFHKHLALCIRIGERDCQAMCCTRLAVAYDALGDIPNRELFAMKAISLHGEMKK